MKAPKRRKTDPKLALRIARAQLRAVRQAVGQYTSSTVPGPAQNELGNHRFIQCWTVTRGYSGITQALDSAGQVWERVSLMGESVEGGVKRKFLKESWWEPIAMERRARSAQEG